MNVKFTGFDYISDNDGMGIHVVAGADDIWLPVDDRERVRWMKSPISSPWRGHADMVRFDALMH